jgi:hypothetical protein
MVTPRPAKSRKGLLLGLAAAVVVAVVVGVVLVVTVGGSDDPTGAATPADAVTGYLDALARGDAEAALSYGQLAPASTELLTDEILQQQIDKWPISDVTIVSTENTGAIARVHVTAKFGDQVSDATLNVQRSDGWKLRQAALKLDNGAAATPTLKALQTITVFGESTDQPRYVFPGWIDFGSSNANLAVQAKPVLLQQLAVEANVPIATTDITLSDSANEALQKALTDALGACTNSNLLAPPGCPLRVDPNGLVEGTARWGRVEDTSTVAVTPNPLMLSAALLGSVTVPFSARTTAGTELSTNLFGVVSGKADLARTPPVVAWN